MAPDIKIDLTTLTEKLSALTGTDMEAAEREARLMGDSALELSISKCYQCILAAKALGVPPDDLRALPARKYQKIVSTVLIFLSSATDEE